MAFGVPLLTGLIAGSTGLSVAGDLMSGSYQAQVAKNNAAIATQNADRASTSAQLQEQQGARKQAVTAGEQLAAQAGSGVDVNSGSPVDVRDSTARTSALETANTEMQGEGQARNYLQQAANFKSQGQFAKTQSYFNAAGDILNGVTSAVSGGTGSMLGKAKPTKLNYDFTGF